jgi:hypothetical protein
MDGGSGDHQPEAWRAAPSPRETKQRWCREPSGHERNLCRILLEVYNPRVLFIVKLLPTFVLRIGKTLAMLVNTTVGQLLCCWEPGESRVLDFVGRHTGALCRKLYDEEVDQGLIRAFLMRRFLFCSITTTATAVQIGCQLADVPLYAVLITCLLTPITLIDKQLSTLVTKMIPRYDRSQIEQLVGGLTRTLRSGPFPDVPDPPRVRAAGAARRCLNLTVLEMCVGATQFCAGLLVVLYSVLLLIDSSAEAARDDAARDTNLEDPQLLLPRYFDTGDGRCELGTFCVAPGPFIIIARCVKELANWLSPWIEWRLTPLKYSSNADVLHVSLAAMVEHAGGLDQLETSLRDDETARRGVAAVARKYLIAGGEPAAKRWELGQPRHQERGGVGVAAWDGHGTAADTSGPSPPPPPSSTVASVAAGQPRLPTHLRKMEMQQPALAAMELLCRCVEHGCGLPPHGEEQQGPLEQAPEQRVDDAAGPCTSAAASDVSSSTVDLSNDDMEEEGATGTGRPARRGVGGDGSLFRLLFASNTAGASFVLARGRTKEDGAAVATGGDGRGLAAPRASAP